MNTKSFLIGLTVGIVGGSTAILFSTPQSGKTLRNNLKTNTASAKEMLTDVKLQFEQVKQAITSLTNEAKNNIPEIINDLKNTVTSFQNNIEPNQKNIKQEIEALQKSINEIEQNMNKFQNKKE